MLLDMSKVDRIKLPLKSDICAEVFVFCCEYIHLTALCNLAISHPFCFDLIILAFGFPFLVQKLKLAEYSTGLARRDCGTCLVPVELLLIDVNLESPKRNHSFWTALSVFEVL